MTRPSQTLLASLLAVLAMLLALTGSASAAFNDAATEPHYGNFLLWESETSGGLPPEPLAFSRERIDYSYDIASGVPVYVRQNPWSAFDPNGLFAQEIDSFVTGFAGWIDEKTNNAVGNTINAVGGFFMPDTEAIIEEVDGALAGKVSLLTAASLAAETNPISRKVKRAVKKGKKLNKGKKVLKKVDNTPVSMPTSTARKTRQKSKAARKEVMKKDGIPTSQQPTSQSKNASGREYSYETPKPGGGTQTKSVQQQTMDRSHPGEAHWEAGTVKKDPITKEVRKTNHGRPKLTNDKSKVDYDE